MRAPFVEEAASLMSSLRVEDWMEAAVPGLDVVECRVREGSSFTGGAGAAGSSVLSIPNGPSGPMESSRLSRVVDWARLPYRRGVRDLEGAALAPLLDIGDEGSCSDLEGACCSARRSDVVSTSANIQC